MVTNDSVTLQKAKQIKELQEQLGGFSLIMLEYICEISKESVRHDIARDLITRNPATQYTLIHLANKPESFSDAIRYLMVLEYIEQKAAAFIASCEAQQLRSM